MIKISTGAFIYGEEQEEKMIDYDFLIDIFPVSNKEYKKFIDAAGYNNDDYWNTEGVKWKHRFSITQPAFWHIDELNHPEQPVVGVSLYEAMAYACWNGKRLPSEEEWERAARGTDGRKYPWGNEFEKKRCNTTESNYRKTTKVNRYPKGKSPEGCYDMAGNVWEWTNSFYDKAKDTYVLRGGSWGDGSGFCRCTTRFDNYPYLRYYYIGFRCVSSVFLSG